jgi:NitT/TauT family transport system substrate-binding protein
MTPYLLNRFATATAVLALWGGMALAQTDDVVELSVALALDDAGFNVTTSSVFRLAQDLGFFEKHGVAVTYVALDGTPQAVAALLAGEVDAADIAIDAAIRLTASGDLVLKGIVATGTGSPFLIAARDDIATLADLAGRSYAIADYGSLDHSLTQAVLRGMGVDPASPAYVPIGAPAVRVQALAAGQVDATTVSFGTYGSIEGTEGIHVLVPSAEFSDFAPALTKFVAVRADAVEENAEALQRFTAALIETSREMAAHPEIWVEAAAAARSDIPRASIERTAGFLGNRWCVNGCIDPAELDASVAFVYANPDFADVPPMDAADLVDLRFTMEALETMGVDTSEGFDARQ